MAYDAVQEESYPEGEGPSPPAEARHDRSPSINNELRDAYKALSDSSWGSKFGGWWNQVKKQGESYYEAAQKELSAANSEGSKGVTDVITNTGTLSLSQPDHEADTTSNRTPQPKAEAPESLSKDIVKEAESILSGFRSMAGERLKKVQAAEDAADEALMKFGSNLRDYLRDAVKVTAPDDAGEGSVKTVLFESRDQEGRRVVHATRFDAQLHVIHTNPESFTKDPQSDEFPKWQHGFDVEKKTDAIAKDLGKYDELRRSMEKLVPEKVEYASFWTRYYFLRHVVEEQEQKRRELLKGSGEEEEVKWDDDEDDDDEQKAPATPRGGASADGAATPKKLDSERSEDMLKPAESRRSNDHSVADSDASYDIVSNAASRGPGSPKEDKDRKKDTVAEQSDEDDWE